MTRFTKDIELGLRWIRCGARLYKRNPWLLAGMGFITTLLVTIFAFLPFIGTPLISLLVPALLASFTLTLDKVAKQKLQIPPAQRMSMARVAPREMVAVFRDESRALQVVMMSFYCMAAVVLTDILLYLIFGSVWGNRTADFQSLPRFVAASAALLIMYGLIAMSLIYTVPMSLLERTPLVPALQRSFSMCRRRPAALLPPAALLLAPVAIGVIGSGSLGVLAYAVAVLVGGVVIPITAASMYCSYRTIFQAPESVREVQHVKKDRRVHAA